MHCIEDYFFKAISRESLDLGDGNAAYKTGLPVADLNLVYMRHTPRNWTVALQRSQEFFDQSKLAFVVVVPTPLLVPEAKQALKNEGYLLEGQSVSMRMDIPSASPSTGPSSFDIRLETAPLHNWMQPLMSAFESTWDICKAYATLHEQALAQHLRLLHFTLYAEGQPISALTLTLHKGVARIDDVGTDGAFQGKGYATHLMKHALQEASRHGARYCYLEASDAGRSVYEKIGFHTVLRNQIFKATPLLILSFRSCKLH